MVLLLLFPQVQLLLTVELVRLSMSHVALSCLLAQPDCLCGLSSTRLLNQVNSLGHN